jgi:hypothetical protein
MEVPRPPAGWSDDSVPAAYVAELQSPVGWSDDGVPAAYLQPAGHSAPVVVDVPAAYLQPTGHSAPVVVDVPAAYLQPAGRSAPAVDDARPASDDIVIIVRGGRRRAAKSSEQRIVYVERGDERYAEDGFAEDGFAEEAPAPAREVVQPRRWALPRREVALPAFFPAPIRDDRIKAVAWEVPTSTEQRARTAFGAGRRLARARCRPVEEPLSTSSPEAAPPMTRPPTSPIARPPTPPKQPLATLPDTSSSDDEPALNDDDVRSATAYVIREVDELRAAAIDGSLTLKLTLKLTRRAVAKRLKLGPGGDARLKRSYKECLKNAMLEVVGVLQMDPPSGVTDAILDEVRDETHPSERPKDTIAVDLAADDESAPSSSTPSVTSSHAYQEPFSPPWADITLAAPAGPAGLAPLPPDSALAAQAAMPSSSSDDDMPSLSSSEASPAPAAASPAVAPTRRRMSASPAGALQFDDDATPTSAAAAELELSPASMTTPSSTMSFATPVVGSPARGTQTQRASCGTSPVRGTQTGTLRRAAATCSTQTPPPPQHYVASPESVMRSVTAASARPRAIELENSMRELDLLVGELERAATRASPATTASPFASPPPSDAQIDERLSSARLHRAAAVATFNDEN